MSEDNLRKIFAQLSSLRDNLPDDHPDNKMEWEEVNLYNKLLDSLEKEGFDASDFRLPQEMLNPEMLQVEYGPAKYEPSGRSSVRLGFLKTKLDSLIRYFSLGDKKIQFGFRDSD